MCDALKSYNVQPEQSKRIGERRLLIDRSEPKHNRHDSRAWELRKRSQHLRGFYRGLLLRIVSFVRSNGLLLDADSQVACAPGLSTSQGEARENSRTHYNISPSAAVFSLVRSPPRRAGRTGLANGRNGPLVPPQAALCCHLATFAASSSKPVHVVVLPISRCTIARRSGTIPTCQKPGVIRLRIEPGSSSWEASSLTSQPPRPLDICEFHRLFRFRVIFEEGILMCSIHECTKVVCTLLYDSSLTQLYQEEICRCTCIPKHITPFDSLTQLYQEEIRRCTCIPKHIRPFDSLTQLYQEEIRRCTCIPKHIKPFDSLTQLYQEEIRRCTCIPKHIRPFEVLHVLSACLRIMN
ncbi:hypothetical protein PR048_033062, partial [Dryococelus australis]